METTAMNTEDMLTTESPKHCSDCGEALDPLMVGDTTCDDCVAGTASLLRWCEDTVEVLYGRDASIDVEEFGSDGEADYLRARVWSRHHETWEVFGGTREIVLRNLMDSLLGALEELRSDVVSLERKAVSL